MAPANRPRCAPSPAHFCHVPAQSISAGTISRACHRISALSSGSRFFLNAGTLSGGEQQMLALGRAIMSEPHLICLDEPSLGLAPMVVQDIFRTIKAINAAGTSVLLVEQNARYALETARRGYVLQTGSIIASGPCATLRNDDRVRQAYLGRSAAERMRL